MTLYALLFYVLSAVIVGSTAMAITRRNLVHAVLYLVLSFVGSAMLFYLLGAPLLALLEVIIYAGAVMVLFLFIVMMIKAVSPEKVLFPLNQWYPAALFGCIYLIIGALLAAVAPGGDVTLTAAVAQPAAFGRYVFEKHWFAIELVSLLLLVALIGVLLLGKTGAKAEVEDEP